MQRNKLTIHIETGNIHYDNFNTGESILSRRKITQKI